MNCETVREQILTGDPLIEPDHIESCDSCRELADKLRAGWGDLDRGLEQWSRGGDFDATFALATKDLPVNNTVWYGDRRFHTVIIAIVAIFAVYLAFQSRPAPEPAVAPPDPIDWTELEEEVDRISAVPWNELSDQEWGLTAENLRQEALALEDAGAKDDPELRGLLFDLYAQIGRAAENRNNSAPPHYEVVEIAGKERVVNWYWFQAAELAVEDPEFLDSVPDDMRPSIVHYVDLINEE